MFTRFNKVTQRSLVIAVLLLLGQEIEQAEAGTFFPNAPMNFARRAHTATLLLDGKVLVTGGQGTNGFYLTDTELFDPDTGTWSFTGSLTNQRAFHTATLLPNGKVLVAGGFYGLSLSSAEIFDPATGIWTPTGSMNTARDSHTATLLANGMVLVAGGLDQSRSSLASTEIYDPNSGTWTDVGALTDARGNHTATLLSNGKVLVAGGLFNITFPFSFAQALSSAELFDPQTGMWTSQNPLNLTRYDHTAVLLPNGKVLVSGGSDLSGISAALSSTELFDPAANIWTNTGAMNVARDLPTLTLLPDGNVFVTGGSGNSGNFLSAAETYTPSLGVWTNNGSMAETRWEHTATLLLNQKILLVGGLLIYNTGSFLASTELYDTGLPITTNGSVRVIINPTNAITLGAQWQIDGGPFQDSGIMVTNLSGGPHVVSFKAVAGWVAPPDQVTTIVSRTATNSLTALYVLNPGAIQVTIDPPQALTDGAMWQVDGGAFQMNGATLTNISVGAHTVAFKTIGGWFAPGNQTVTVETETITNISGTYSLTSGALQVTLNPPDAISAGARWQVDGGAFQTNGAVVTGLAIGDHLLTFKEVSGWFAPVSQIVVINTDATNLATGNYNLGTGAIAVTINPAGAISAGAKWSVDGGALQNSGARVDGLSVGEHVIAFNSLVGWITPSNQTVLVDAGITNAAVGAYVSGELTRPTLTIKTPKSNQRWSNSVFTVIGAAKDNVKISTVFVQVNGGAWALAVISGLTDWSAANVVLTPGTNTIRAYAVDTSNNPSTTNSVKIVYILSDRLIVLLNGKGTVSPNYSNAFLQIGKNYSMTAKGIKGFRFANWSGSLSSTAAKLTFNMQSNLSFTANFLDVTRPVNVLLTPKANQRWSNEVFNVTGKASDNDHVGNVWYQLNGGIWSEATTGNNWTNWNVPSLLLTPGTNIIKTYAADLAGNHSLTNTIKFIYVLTDRLFVQLDGRGTLSPNYSNAVLQIGRNYSMTAKAKTGFRFINWTGSFSTNNAKITFNMQSNLNFTAHFLDIARPVNAITTPKVNQKWSNAVFTAVGKATDNVGVANVYFRLNGGDWNEASLALNHIDWTTPNLSLLSGSNQIQAFAADAVGNLSLTNKTSFTYKVLPTPDWAPDSLNGLVAHVTMEDEDSTEDVSFDITTFAEIGVNTNSDNYGVGNYLYNKTDTNAGQLGLVLALPSNVTNQETQVSIVFTNHYRGYFTNDEEGLSGGISFVIATNFLPGRIAGKTIVAVDDGGQTNTLKLVNDIVFTKTSSPGGGSGSGFYTFTRFSPVSALLAFTFTNSADLGRTAYVQTTFTNTGNGRFFVTTFDNLGVIQDTGAGVFKLK